MQASQIKTPVGYRKYANEQINKQMNMIGYDERHTYLTANSLKAVLTVFVSHGEDNFLHSRG